MWKDSETELDFLDYNYLVQSMLDIIKDDTLLPACIGLYGDWGSGKSSLIKMCKSQLESQDTNVKCLIFNGWLFENYDDAKTAILGEILDAFKEEAKVSDKVMLSLRALYNSVDKFKLAKNALKYGVDLFLTGGLGTLTNLTIKKVVEAASDKIPDVEFEKIETAIKDELNYKELRDDIREFQKEFSNLLAESKISRLVIFIDELDRCRPDTILETLEAIKLFLFTGKTAFVLGADERHIAYAVKSKFKDIEGQEIDIGKEYLEKLVQYPIKIPRLDSLEVETYIGCLLLQSELEAEVFEDLIKSFQVALSEDFTTASLIKVAEEKNIDVKDTLITAHQLSKLLTVGLNGNPRQCKRFLNMMDLRIRQASYKNKKLDQRILAKIMMLEYFRVSMFKKMATMAKNDSLKEELIELEKSCESNNYTIEETHLNELKNCVSDDWFMNWCSIEPKLGSTDLKIYFYFSRTSLEERLSLMTSNLSPKARSTLSNLMSQSETVIKKTMDDIESLVPNEIISIINAMGDQLLSMSKANEIQLKAFLSLSSKKPEFAVEGFNILDKFSVEQFPASIAAHIANFAKETGRVEQLKELADRKWSENKLFIKFLNNSLEQE